MLPCNFEGVQNSICGRRPWGPMNRANSDAEKFKQ